MNLKKIGAATARIAVVALFALVSSPFGVELLSFLAKGSFPDTDAALEAYSALPWSFVAALLEKNNVGYALAWMAIVLAVAAINAATTAGRSPDRIVKGGSPQGDSRLIESRWEIRRKNDRWNGRSVPGSAGLVISADHKNLYYDCTLPHWIIVGTSGAGKTQLIVIETIALCAAAGWNLLVTGKEELVELTGDRVCELGYERVILSLKGYPGSSRYNPIDLVIECAEAGRRDEAQGLARQIANDLIPIQGGESNPYFPQAARSLLMGVILAVAYSDAPRAAKNMASVHDVITRGTTGDGKDPSAPLKDYIRSLGPDHPAFGPCSDFLSDKGTTAQLNVLSTLKVAIAIFGDEQIRRMTATSDVGTEKMIRGKSACYLHLPKPGDPYRVIFTCFVNQYWSIAQQVAGGTHGRLPNETAIIADEFGNLGRVDAAPQIASLGRGFGLHLYAFVQNYSQLNMYNDPGDGGAGSEWLTGSMAGRLVLVLTNEDDRQRFSRQAGKRVVRTRSTTDNLNSNMGRSSGESYGEVVDDLVHEHEWQFRAPIRDGAIVIKTGANAAPERAGVYRMPLDYAANTPAGPFFGLGDKKHDAAKREDFYRRMEEAAGRESAEVQVWVPAFPQKDEGSGSTNPIAADEMAFWD